MTATKTVSKTKAGKARLVVRKSPRKMPESSNNNDDEDEMSTSGGKTRPVSQSQQRQNVGQDEPRHSDAQSDQAVVGGRQWWRIFKLKCRTIDDVSSWIRHKDSNTVRGILEQNKMSNWSSSELRLARDKEEVYRLE
ncbi:hypothetical protein PF011_g11654 [Phytophthora fragariae]|uniref:Uncharacterized protein n=1 Tax=Phytophthora fragariae TaxID=53985 RepID=A0A6A3KKF0_9STRA|nr:hypothetical protein PF011_g11654 [Phytophthora fragariae]